MIPGGTERRGRCQLFVVGLKQWTVNLGAGFDCHICGLKNGVPQHSLIDLCMYAFPASDLLFSSCLRVSVGEHPSA